MFNALSFLVRKFGTFRRSESGMTLPLMAVGMIIITGMTGLAIDVARMQLVQSKLQFSLDSAGLAAGSTFSTTTMTSEVTKFLNTNFNGYLGATVSNISATVDPTNTVISVNAQATLPTTFMNVLGVSLITVNASTQVSRGTSGLELVMVLDNTGSMVNDNKITSLKTAATTLVNSLYSKQTPGNQLWVGLVPFSQTVNIGTGYPNWMDQTYDNTLVWPANVSWAGCVEAREQNGMDITDDPPSQQDVTTLFREYYNPCPNGQKWNANGTSCVSDCTNGFTWNSSTNSCVCGTGKQVVNGSCVSVCSNGYTYNNQSGTCVCGTGNSVVNGSCVPNCTGDLQWNNSSHSCQCQAGTHLTGTNTCSNNCVNGFQWSNSSSSCVCPSSSYVSGSSCLPHCSSPYTWNGSVCVPPTCSSGQTWNGTACVKNGPS